MLVGLLSTSTSSIHDTWSHTQAVCGHYFIGTPSANIRQIITVTAAESPEGMDIYHSHCVEKLLLALHIGL